MTRMSHPALALGLAVSPPAAGAGDPSSETGRLAYQYCVACHGHDGKGIEADGLVMAPSLHDSAMLKGNFPELLTAVILKGIVKEDAKFVQAMPPHEKVLKDPQIAALIGYLTKEYGGKQISVTDGEVLKWRSERSSQTSSWKRGDVESMYLEASAPRYLSDVRYAMFDRLAGECDPRPRGAWWRGRNASGTALEDPFIPADVRERDWNQVRVVAKGRNFTFFINGKLASEFTDNAEIGRFDSGGIALQIHDKGMRVEFKDIQLKKLQ